MFTTNLKTPKSTPFQAALSALYSRRNSKAGFTLVELLVVILIIGILLAIAVPTFLNQQSKAQDTHAKADLSSAYKVAKSEAASNSGSFPAKAALISAISSSEPELNVVGLVTNDEATVGDTGVVYVTDQDLTLAERSASGALCVLTVAGHGAPDITCDDSNPGLGGGPGGGGGPAGGAGSQDLAMVANYWDDYASQAFYRLLTGSSTSINTSVIATSTNTMHYEYANGGFLYAIDGASGGDTGELTALMKRDLGSGAISQVTPAAAFCESTGQSGLNNVGAVPINGGRLVVICSNQHAIHETDVDGSNETTLISGGTYNRIASNGTTVAFTDGSTIWTIPVSGGSPDQVIATAGSVSGIAINGSGTIAYIYNAYGPNPPQLYTIPSSGGSPNQLTNNTAFYAGEPQFSADGSHIACTVGDYNTGAAEGYVIDTDGIGLTQVSSESGGSPGYNVGQIFWTN